MTLQPTEIEPASGPLPDRVVAFLADAEARIDRYYERPGHVPGRGFIPSDYQLGYRSLVAVQRAHPDARRFCEWGSGFGVVTGLAAMLEFESHGIEVDAELISAARSLLADHGLDADIVHGSFIPEQYANTERLSDHETRTVLHHEEAYHHMDLAIDDFEVVFAYPWPGEEVQYCELFDRFADYNALLLTYSRSEAMRAYRKVGDGRG